MKAVACLSALALLCLFAAHADAFAPSLGVLARAPLRSAPVTRRNAVSSLNMQEVRGICPICNEPVTTADVRERDDQGNYCHTACVEGQNAAQGQARLSPQEIAQLKRRNTVATEYLDEATGGVTVGKGRAFNPFGGFKNPFAGGGGPAAPAAPRAPPPTVVYDTYGGDVADLPPPGSTGAAPMFGGTGGAAPMRVNPATRKDETKYDDDDDAFGAPTQAPAFFKPPPPQQQAPPPPAPVAAAPTRRGAAVAGQPIPPQPAGERAYPAAGLQVPLYWVEGCQYLANKKNEFEIDEPVAIFRSDGTVKFATVINYKIAPDGVSYLYDVQVDQKGSYYEDRYPDSLFKIMYDIETEGVVLKEEATRGWW